MRNFFYPGSVAVFGVSDTPSNMARIIIENLERFGFGGKVYPVGKGKGAVGGSRIIPTIDEADSVPDLAVQLIPAVRIPETLEQCGRKGIRHVILESGGFSELSDSKKTLEEEIRQISAKWDMKVIGPNCFGVINLEARLVLPFFIFDPGYMRTGGISLISQSGGILYDTCMIASCENLGLNKLVSIGNKLLLDENECLEYLISDPGTSVIGLYLEDFSDGRRLIEIASSTDKPIVLLKANRSPTGREIARFHTAALAGDDRVAEAALREAGVHQVESLAQMIDAFKIFSLPLAKGPRLAVITRSGGHGVLSADGVHRHGFELAPLSENFFSAVKEKKINVIRTTNPVDVGDIYDLASYSEIMDRALAEEAADGVLYVVTYSSESDGLKVRNFIGNASEQVARYGKPAALCLACNRDQWPIIRKAVDFPIFGDVDYALRALAESRDHFAFADKKSRAHARLTGSSTKALRARQPRKAAGPSRILGSPEAFSLLEAYGLSVLPSGVAKDLDGARLLAAKMGYPVAMKIESPSILHKSEKNGVVLDITDEAALGHAWTGIGGERCLIQKMASSGTEVIIGGKRDQEFGHVVLFGLGGIFVEILRDAAIRLVPVDPETAMEMVNSIQGAPILKGARGRPRADITALTTALSGVSRLLIDHPEIRNLDINPLIVHEDGKWATAVDVKIEVDR